MGALADATLTGKIKAALLLDERIGAWGINVNTVGTDKSNGWSAFGSFAFTPQIAAFGRYDWVKPNRDTNSALHDHYFNLGVDYKPLPPLDIALVWKRDRANNGFLATSNGTIGGLNNSTSGTYSEVGIFGQFVF